MIVFHVRRAKGTGPNLILSELDAPKVIGSRPVVLISRLIEWVNSGHLGLEFPIRA
jgi:hypothetical protein